jgi:AraC-like DNA-binding protein
MPGRPLESTPATPTVSADLIDGLIDCARRAGVARVGAPADIRADGRATAIDPARYSVQVVLELWERVTRLANDPIIGFRMALVATHKTFGLLGEIVSRCDDVLDAFRKTERYSAIASQGARVTVTRDARRLAITLSATLPPGRVEQGVVLWGLTNLALLPQRLVAHEAPLPVAVECTLASPGAAALAALRERLPFRFDAAAHRVVFDARAGDVRIDGADTRMREVLAQFIDARLGEIGSAESFEQGMRTVLRSMLNGTMPTLASLSSRAGMSSRTLQRRLAEAKTTFERLRQEVLRELADDMLARGKLTHGEIAFALGYSEESAFAHAYRAWTGHAPGARGHRGATRH